VHQGREVPYPRAVSQSIDTPRRLESL